MCLTNIIGGGKKKCKLRKEINVPLDIVEAPWWKESKKDWIVHNSNLFCSRYQGNTREKNTILLKHLCEKSPWGSWQKAEQPYNGDHLWEGNWMGYFMTYLIWMFGINQPDIVEPREWFQDYLTLGKYIWEHIEVTKENGVVWNDINKGGDIVKTT